MKKSIFVLTIIILSILLCACRSGNSKTTISLLEDYIQEQKNFEDYGRRGLPVPNAEESTPDEKGQDGNYQYEIKNGQVTITGYIDRTASFVDIPQRIEGKPVTRIGDEAFSNMYNLETVVIPDSVTRMDNKVFWDCTSLKTVSVSHNLDWISSGVFGGCSSLESIDLSCCKIDKLSNHTFYNCSSLINVSLPKTLKSIGQLTFSGCTSLTELVIPESVQKIDELTFFETPWYDQLSEDFVVVGDGVLIKYNGHGGHITIPQNVKYISDAFRHNNDIVGVSFSPNVVVIGAYAFSGCCALADIVFPETNCVIGTSAFSGCGMTSVDIPDTVQYICDCAFSDCTNLRHVRLPEKLEYIPYACFHSCALENIVLPKQLTYIGEYAFTDNRLTSVFIPETVEDIRENAFWYNYPLTIRCVEESAAYYYAQQNDDRFNTYIIEKEFIETKENKEFEYDCYSGYVNLIKYLGDIDNNQFSIPYTVDNKPVNMVDDSIVLIDKIYKQRSEHK